MLRRFVVAGGGGGGRFEIAAIGGEGYGSMSPVVRRGMEESALGSERRRGRGRRREDELEVQLTSCRSEAEL